MNNLWVALLILGLVSMPAFSQNAAEEDYYDIRDVDIDIDEEQGALVQEALDSNSNDEKIRLLESFVQQYPEDYLVDYVHLLLQGLYLEKQSWSDSVKYGKLLVEMVPDDLEVLHNLTKGLEGTQDWAALLPHLLKTKSYAKKAATVEPPSEDLGEDELAAFTGQRDYAQGIVDYVEYSLFTSGVKQADPGSKLQYLDALLAQYPSSKFKSQANDQIVMTSRQTGNMAKMAQAMKASLETNDRNEEYLYTLAELSLSSQQIVEAHGYAQRLLDVLASKPKPENVGEENWLSHKARFGGFANLIMGKVLVVEADNKDKNKFREARVHLLEAVDPIKAQGGPNYQALSYFLGICYIKLDIGGDNIDKALFWMDAAAKTEGSLKEAAGQAVASIQAAINK
jgi:tetratricopeptide (TPR) repeat protein